MNWDISIGQCKQWYGRVLQVVGRRLDRRGIVSEGERFESTGRLQARYGLVKHQVQWGAKLVRIPIRRAEADAARERGVRSIG